MRNHLFIVGVVVVLVSSTLGGVVGGKVLSNEKLVTEHMKHFTALLAVVEDSYVDKIPTQKVVSGAINGLLNSLDPHSNFLDEEAYASLQEEQHGSFYGLGISIQSINGLLTVISPIEGTPAYKAGLRAGDIISEIEGEPTKGHPTTVLLKKLRGPKGTKVTITIEREGWEKPIQMTLVRDEIPVNSVSYAFMIRPGTGYIRIKNFTETTTDELEDSLKKLKEHGMKEIIIDLRFNTGGLLDQAIDVSDIFLEKGAVVVSTKGRISEANTTYRCSNNNGFEDLPLVVLVNRSSASASEIVAGAIQDHDRGVIVGTTTWGKGLVQSVYRLGSNTALALTTARYYTPSGRLIQRDYSRSFYDYYYTDLGVDEDPQNREKAYTDTGREVFGGGGITPDVKMEQRTASKFMDLLNSEYVFFNFAKRFAASDERKVQSELSPMTSKLKVIDRTFQVDEKILDEFREHLRNTKIQFTEQDLQDNLPAIKNQIRQEIFATLWGSEEGYKIASNQDKQIQTALEVFPKAEALIKMRKQKTARLQP
ncbi:S41 family peptidase [bacterium]|nr:S41 family peptidase [bacterium]MCI0603484.1 S41 family peptidase [bacterium]